MNFLANPIYGLNLGIIWGERFPIKQNSETEKGKKS